MPDAPNAPTTTEPTKTEVAKEGFQQGQTETATPPEGQQKTGQQPQMFTEDQVKKFRKDEHDKVYGELTKAQQELQKFQAAEAERAKKAQEAEAKAQAEAKQKAEADMDAKQLLQSREVEWNKQFEQSNKQWEERFNQINAEREQERALAEKERKFHEFVAYRNDRLNAVRDTIAPELIDLVSGSTPEELEASITTLQGKSEQIAQTVQQYAQQARASQRGVSSASFPAVGPDTDNPAGKQYTAEEIQGMNFEQYAEFRRKMGIGSSQGKGLFG
jgi:DNA repair exonuclease SbcCD ATPase subunit